MFNLSDHLRLQKLLSDTIPLLCKNSLGCQLALSVEALIGVTVANESSENGSEVLMVSFKQTVSACGSVKSYAWTELPALTEAVCSNNATLNDKHEVHKVCNDIWKNQSGHKKHVDHESGCHSNDSRFEGCGNDISLRTSYKRGRKRRKMWQDDSRSVCERREAVENSKCVKIENDIDVGAFRDVLLLHETSEGMPEWSEQYGYQESLQGATGNNIEQYDDHESLHAATGMNGAEYADQESQHKDTDINGELSDNLESLHEKATDINGVQYGSMESLHGDASINGEVDSLVNSESLRLAVKGSHQPKVKWSNACAMARGTGKLVKYQNTPAEGSLVQPRVKLIKKAGPRMCTSRVQSRQSEVLLHNHCFTGLFLKGYFKKYIKCSDLLIIKT
jgi:hypothetical protein